MNKKNIILILLILIIITPLNSYAYFNTNEKIINTLHTIDLKFSLNANKGSFINKDIVTTKDEIKLPIPIREGYTFEGYISKDKIYKDKIKINELNNKELIASWKPITYSIYYDLDGGVIENLKDTYNVTESFRLQEPTKEDYIFEGWIGSNGDIPQKDIIINEGTTGTLEYKAVYSLNYALINIIPTIDNASYKDGFEDYTFNLYINNVLVKENIKTYSDYIKVGSEVRVVANELIGRTTSYNETIIIENKDEKNLYPTWKINDYKSEFLYNNKVYATTINKYNTKVKTPNINATTLGSNDYFYIITGFTPFEGWIQKDHTMKFAIILEGRNCVASFGNASMDNAYRQQALLNANGYSFCKAASWGAVECAAKFDSVLNVYNNAWNILP